MSHVAVRIVADWLQDPTYGINSVAEDVPRYAGDEAPPVVHVYDETRYGWVTQQQVPRDIQFPAVLIFLLGAKYDAGVPESQDTGARTVSAPIQLVAQLVLQDSSSERAASAGMYLMRALRNSLLLLDDPARDSERTALGTQIAPADGITQGQVDAPVGDNLVSAGALIVSYQTTEVTILT